jgi:hypothetical protein
MKLKGFMRMTVVVVEHARDRSDEDEDGDDEDVSDEADVTSSTINNKYK